MASVAEGDETVQVCITLSNVTVPTKTSISIVFEAVETNRGIPLGTAMK